MLKDFAASMIPWLAAASVLADTHWSCSQQCFTLMMKKSSELPCACQGQPQLIDLGLEYYPRYLGSVECGRNDCWRPPYKCKGRVYKVRVLKRRDEEDQDLLDSSLPQSLRLSWKFVLVPVTVACVCAL